MWFTVSRKMFEVYNQETSKLNEIAYRFEKGCFRELDEIKNLI